MKKNLYFASLIVLATFASCNPTGTEVTPATVDGGSYENGIIVINEGNFTSADGNFGFYQLGTNSMFVDIVNTANNGVSMNAIIQNAVDTPDKMCVVTNNPDKLVVFDRKTMKVQADINTGLLNPFDVAVANGKAYITTWGANYFPTYSQSSVKVINLSNNQVVQTIAVGKEITSIIATAGKVFVACPGDDKVLVINPANDQLETPITIQGEPDAFTLDSNAKLWVLCSAGKLVRLNPTNSSIEATITGVSASAYQYNEKIVFGGSNLYWIGETTTGFTNKGIFSMPISSTTAPTTPLITGDKFYGVGYANGQFMAGILAPTPNSYSSSGKIAFYNANGTVSRTITSAGIAPNGFLAR